MDKKDSGRRIIKYPSGEHLSIYIYGEITDPSDYLEELEAIRTARESDTISLYFNTPGGDMLTALAFISAMNYSGATILGVIDGECSSAGTFIFLAAHEYEISPLASMLIHTYSTWLGGKSHELHAHSRFTEKYYSTVFEKTYAGFLSEEEIQRVITGQDIWLDSQEIANRCKNLLDYRWNSKDNLELNEEETEVGTNASEEVSVSTNNISNITEEV